LYIHYHTALRIYGYPVGPNTWSSLSWQISRSYHVYFCIQRILDFLLFNHISTHRYSHVTHESKNVDKGKKHNLSVSKIKEWKFIYTTLHKVYNCLKTKKKRFITGNLILSQKCNQVSSFSFNVIRFRVSYKLHEETELSLPTHLISLRNQQHTRL
jgi:hypothetical protein